MGDQARHGGELAGGDTLQPQVARPVFAGERLRLMRSALGSHGVPPRDALGAAQPIAGLAIQSACSVRARGGPRS